MVHYVIRAPRGLHDAFVKVGGTTDHGLAHCLARLESRAIVEVTWQGKVIDETQYVGGVALS